MEINNNRHNILSSNIAPNPLSVKYWADLNADSNGGVIKYHDGKSWVLVNNQSNPAEVAFDNRLTTLEVLAKAKVDKDGTKVLSDNNYTTAEKNKLGSLNNYDDTEVRDLIMALSLKVGAIEKALA